MNNKIELLAPAGSKESFFAAVQAGADAVYIGLKEFSARAKAKNFSYSELYKLCNYAKTKNVKVFVAFNTLIKQSEIQQAFKALRHINASGADAIIIQDLALANITKKFFPEIKLHASTQLSVHNSFGAKQAKKMGFSRAVLARELSFEQIKKINASSDLELEIFCHGALCFCVSGLCLFSSFIGGYSGNRGLCTQPCRRLWTVENKQEYFLSPKDLQLAKHIQLIKDSHITSIKIEGRMKNSDYVYKTVKAYRILLDSSQEDMAYALQQAEEILKFDYARQKTSFNFAKTSQDVFEPGKSKNTGLYLGLIANKTDSDFTITSADEIRLGDTLRVVNKSKDNSAVLTVEKIIKNKKIYTISYDGIYIENGFELYKIADSSRPKLADVCETVQQTPEIADNISLPQPKIRQNAKLPGFFIRIDNLKWLDLINKTDCSVIIKLKKSNLQNIKALQMSEKYFVEFPPYIDEHDLDSFKSAADFLIDKKDCGFFINNISHFEFFEGKNAELYAGQYLYTLNAYSAEFLSRFNVKAFTVSWEDDLQNITMTAKNLNNSLIVFLSGFAELAVSKMVFVKDIQNKFINSKKDEFKIMSYDDRNIIIPKYPVSLFNFKNNLVKAKINSFAIDLSYIEPNQNYLLHILKAFNGELFLGSNYNFNFKRFLK